MRPFGKFGHDKGNYRPFGDFIWHSHNIFLCNSNVILLESVALSLPFHFSVREADSTLSSLRSAVTTLQSSVRHVRSEIADPHRQIRAKTLQLSSLHRTAELLQATIRVLRLSKKLRDVMDPSDHPERLDLAKAAQEAPQGFFSGSCDFEERISAM
ncbi:conserved oligomeric Golgi complex subunit 5-like [Actinidia eriantha]|uniref:conserved oligomeric Golgi complex subunit 5-like n=1 Tax=Actinidia eriantha TaxID=165200 RepID=UPI00258F6DBE|nr:conserved oligomeric Golgi complex subunit 5-like [Actinidia eriantha]